VKRLSDTLTYRGIASEAVFTDPPGADWFKRTVPNYLPQICIAWNKNPTPDRNSVT